MPKAKRDPVRLKVMILVSLIAIIIIAAFGFFSNRSMTQTIYQRGRAQLEARLKDGTMELRIWLAGKAQSLLSYADIFEHQDYPMAARLFLDAAVRRGERDPEIYSLYFGPKDAPSEGGIWLDSSGWEPPAEYDWTKRDWYTQAVQANRLVYSEPYVDADTGQLVFTISFPVYRGRDFVGVIGADIFMTTVVRLVSSLRPTGSSRTYLVNEDFLFVTHENFDRIMVDTFYEGSGLPIDDTYFTDQAVQVAFLSQYYMVSMRIPELNWRLVSWGDVDDVISDVRRTRLVIVSFAGGVLLVSLLVAFILLLFYTAPPADEEK